MKHDLVLCSPNQIRNNWFGTDWETLWDDFHTWNNTLFDAPIRHTLNWYKGGMETKVEENEFVVTMPLPGIPLENVVVEVKNGVLKVEGKNNVKDKTITRTSNYSYSLDIGNMDPNLIKANYKDGVLEIRVPKQTDENANKSVKIEVK